MRTRWGATADPSSHRFARPGAFVGRRLALPDRHAVRMFLAYGVVVEVVFAVVYFGCNWLTAQRAQRLHLFFDWEMAIPFVPWMIWVYMSIAVLLVLPLFQLDAREMPWLGRQMLVGTVLSGAVFLALPAELGFIRNEDAGAYARAYRVLHAVALPHNLVPSLHIVFSVLIARASIAVATPALRAAYACWLVAVTVSVLLVHQHHLIDIAAGYAMAWLCVRVVPESGPASSDAPEAATWAFPSPRSG